MELMNNQYLILEDIETDFGILKNSTRVNLLPDINPKFYTDEYILYTRLEDDRLLEAISFDIYKNTNYWDILMVLNGIKNMDELPVNYDRVLLRVDKYMEKWQRKGKLLHSVLTDEDINKKYQEVKEYEINKNERFRNFKYLSPDDLSVLLADLEVSKNNYKINPKLIVQKDK